MASPAQKVETRKTARVAPVLAFMQSKMAAADSAGEAEGAAGRRWDAVHVKKPILPDPSAAVEPTPLTPTVPREPVQDGVAALPGRPSSPGSSAPQMLTSQQLIAKCESRIEHSVGLIQSVVKGLSFSGSGTDDRQARARASLAAEEAQLCVAELKGTLSNLRALRHTCGSTEAELTSLRIASKRAASPATPSQGFKGLLPDIEHDEDTKLGMSEVKKQMSAQDDAQSLYASTQSSASSASRALEHQLSVVTAHEQMLQLEQQQWARKCKALENDRARSQAEFERERKVLEGKVKALEQRLARAPEAYELESLQEAAAHAQALTDQSQHRESETRQALARVTEQLKQQQHKANEAMVERDALAQASQQHMQGQAAAASTIEQMTTQASALREELTALHKDKAKLTEEMDEVTEERDKLKEEKGKLREERDALQEAVERHGAQASEQRDQHQQQQHKQQQQQIDELRRERNKLRSDLGIAAEREAEHHEQQVHLSRSPLSLTFLSLYPSRAHYCHFPARPSRVVLNHGHLQPAQGDRGRARTVCAPARRARQGVPRAPAARRGAARGNLIAAGAAEARRARQAQGGHGRRKAAGAYRQAAGGNRRIKRAAQARGGGQGGGNG